MTSIERVPASRFEAMIRAGMSTGDMADEFGCSLTKVRHHLRVRGVPLPRKQWSIKAKAEAAARDERIVELFRSGMLTPAIGLEVGITGARVRQILKAKGLTKKDGGRTVRAQASRKTQEAAPRPARAPSTPAPAREKAARPVKGDGLPTGVYFDAKRGSYRAQRSVQGVVYHIGTFGSAEAAHAAWTAFDHTKHPKFRETKQNW